MQSTEVLFYQLDRHPLDKVLPGLLEKTLERGWRAAVQTGVDERLDALDALLWTYRDDSFLPHGKTSGGYAAEQPVFLTTGADNPNGASVRFLIDGADCDEIERYARVVYLFDGGDGEACAKARAQWKAAKAGGFTVTYWQQSEKGRWEKKA
jgi:DNA polymerase-3 subunit chi